MEEGSAEPGVQMTWKLLLHGSQSEIRVMQTNGRVQRGSKTIAVNVIGS